MIQLKLKSFNWELPHILKTIKIMTVITYIPSVWVTRPTRSHLGATWTCLGPGHVGLLNSQGLFMTRSSVELVTQTDWIDVITVFILIVFKKCGSSKLDNFSFYQNRVIKNPILFYQYLSLQKLHRNGYVLKIYVWISVFRRKKLFDNPVLGCWRRQLIDLL